MAMARELLGSSRLVTLIGPGGVGKTRLAVKVAGQLPRAEFDDVRMVELSGLRNPGLLPNTIAAALGLPEQTARPPLDVLVEYLADKNMLLLLDTCEHLLDACATLTDVLLRNAARLRVLATSRQALEVPGEHTVPVAPLDPEREAVKLFSDRASAVVPGFALTESNQATIVALCRRLDGIPLAIELAVVRLRGMPLQQLAVRLEDRFRLLTSGQRTALERHQTLHSAIAWSHELCTEQERALWARLSVFAGDFDMEAAERVCADDHKLPDLDIMDALLGLVDKSIVLWTETGQDTRYRLLDTIREFGREQLGDDETLYLNRHRDCFRARVDAFTDRFFTADQEPLYWRLHADQANLRAALGHSYAGRETAAEGLSLATQLWTYWVSSAAYAEGRYWIDKGLDLLPEPTGLRALALRLTAWFGVMQGEHDWPLDRLTESLDIARDLADPVLEAFAHQYLGLVHMYRGDKAAFGWYQTATEKFAALGPELTPRTLYYQHGYLHALHGDPQGGLALCEVSPDALAGIEGRWVQAWAHTVKAVCYWQAGDRRQAAEMASEALWMKNSLGEVFGVAHCLELLAWVGAAGQRAGRAAWLLGAADGLWRKIGRPLFGMDTLLGYHAAAEQAAAEALGQAAYQRIFAVGVALAMTDAVRYALDDLDEPPAACQPGSGLGLLTAREREVAALVSEGLSNREIAERLVISKRTTDSHVEHILTKLGFTSRAQISALVARETRE
jgi:predicted ATPase/DNA-binding CsgD family transcriptional regulator